MKWEKREGLMWTIEGAPFTHIESVWCIEYRCIILTLTESTFALYDWFGHADSKTTYPTLEAAKLAAELIYG